MCMSVCIMSVCVGGCVCVWVRECVCVYEYMSVFPHCCVKLHRPVRTIVVAKYRRRHQHVRVTTSQTVRQCSDREVCNGVGVCARLCARACS